MWTRGCCTATTAVSEIFGIRIGCRSEESFVTVRTHRGSRRWAAVASVALIPLVFAACGGGGDSDAAKNDAPAAEATTVTMKLVAYQPEKLTVDAGTKVIWKQTDPGAHTVTSGTVEQGGAGVTQQPDDRFDSGNIATGDSYEFTFNEAGTYPYFCRLHPATMRGEIQVR